MLQILQEGSLPELPRQHALGAPLAVRELLLVGGEVAVHILEIHDGGQASTQLNRLFLVRRLLRAQRQVHERAVRQQRDEANGDAGREEACIPTA